MSLSPAGESKKSLARSTSVKSVRRGGGTLLHEGMPALDTFYDWHQAGSIAGRCGTAQHRGPGGRASWSLQTAVPRPWQKPPDQRFGRHLAPGDYEPSSPNHLMSSSSIGWASRGRTGPLGSPFDGSRASSAFSSVTARGMTLSESKQPSKATKEDFFILRSDNRRQALARNDWGQTLSRRVHDSYVPRPMPSPPTVIDFFGSGSPQSR